MNATWFAVELKLCTSQLNPWEGGGGRDLAGKHGASAKYCLK